VSMLDLAKGALELHLTLSLPAQPLTEARIRDPDAAVDSDELGNRGPPSILVRLASALTYLVPWIDIIGLGRMIYHKFPGSLWLYEFPGAALYASALCLPAGRRTTILLHLAPSS